MRCCLQPKGDELNDYLKIKKAIEIFIPMAFLLEGQIYQSFFEYFLNKKIIPTPIENINI
jgi:hypothetical protein